MNDTVFKALKAFVAGKPQFKVAGINWAGRIFVERQLRFELSTAAYGSIAALQIFNSDDPQVARGIEVMPRAKELALAALRVQARGKSNQ